MRKRLRAKTTRNCHGCRRIGMVGPLRKRTTQNKVDNERQRTQRLWVVSSQMSGYLISAVPQLYFAPGRLGGPRKAVTGVDTLARGIFKNA